MAKKKSSTANPQVGFEISQKDIYCTPIYIPVKAYPLREDQLNTLLKNQSNWMDWSTRFFFGAIGLTYKPLSIIFQYLYQGKFTPEKNTIESNVLNEIHWWDISSVLIAFVAGLICFCISKKKKTERDKLAEDIRNVLRNESNG